MAHAAIKEEQLLTSVRWIHRQVNAIERALESKRECAGILQVIWLLAVVLNGQTAVVMERHAQFHVLSPDSRNNSARGHVAKELINIGRIYLK